MALANEVCVGMLVVFAQSINLDVVKFQCEPILSSYYSSVFSCRKKVILGVLAFRV